MNSCKFMGRRRPRYRTHLTSRVNPADIYQFAPNDDPVMKSSTAFTITRNATEWGDSYTYTCRNCGASGETVAAITHEPGCSGAAYLFTDGTQSPPDAVTREVSDQDDVLPFSETTNTLITDIIREVTWLAEFEDHTTDELNEKLETIPGARWAARGSSHRAVIGLGRTSPRGEFHCDDHRGVVLKIDPRFRFDEEYTPVSSNLDELFTWEKAVETGTDQFFAEILAAAPDGMWLAMEYCIPISFAVRSPMESRDMIRDPGGEQYINPLRAALRDHGWENPDYKYGNVGLTDNGRTVLIDYGTGPDYVTE